MKRSQRKRLEVSQTPSNFDAISKMPNRARKETSAIAELFPDVGRYLSPKEAAAFRKLRGVDNNGIGRITLGKKGRQEKEKE